MRPLHALGIAVSLLAALPAWAFEPTGEVIFNGGGVTAAGATFDGDRLVGPAVNLTRDAGGWAGDLAGQNLHLLWQGKDKLVGPNVTVVFRKADNGDVRIEGLWQGTRFRVDIDQKKARGRFGNCSLDMKQTAPGLFRGDIGCQRGRIPQTAKGTLKLLGDAAKYQPDQLPQLALALIAVLPS